MAKPELTTVSTEVSTDKVEQVVPLSASLPKREINPLARNELQLFEFQNATWRAVLKGVEKEQLTPDFLMVYFSVVSDKLRAFDSVILLDDSYYAEILIRASEKGGDVQAVVLRIVDLPPIRLVNRKTVPPGYRIDYFPTTHRYQAFREEGNLPMTPEMDDWEVCRAELVNHNSLKAIK